MLKQVEREQRLCHCGYDIEDEAHFLLVCETYLDIRIRHKVNNKSKIEDLLNDEKHMLYIAELVERRSSLNLQEA